MSTKNPLQKLFKTQQSQKGQQSKLRGIRSDSLYNLRDFLPQTSTAQNRQNTKSIILLRTQTNFNNNKQYSLNINNVQQKLFEQKMNKLKERNHQLQKDSQQKQEVNKKQADQIVQLKKKLQKMEIQKTNKLSNLKIWSYKYHIDYVPKQKHKYNLAVQTEDSFSKNHTQNLKARDFEDIYRRLNSNPSTIELGTRKMKNQGGIIQSISQFSGKNLSMINRNYTLNLQNNFQQNNSLFRLPKRQDFQQNQNKQNKMQNENLNFQKNPMEMDFTKILAQEKPISQQYLQIYPVQEEYLDSIIGQILCGDIQ